MSCDFGLVLSGGGARGVTHAGVIQALQEAGLEPGCIAGSSAGAIAAAFYAAGYPAEDILQFFKEADVFKLSNFSLDTTGLLKTSKYKSLLAPYFEDKRFEDLDRKLMVSVTDLQKAKEAVFETGPLLPVLLASAAFPVVFQPVEIDGSLYLDGSIARDFPVELVRNHCEKVLGVFVNPVEEVEKEALHSLFPIIERVFLIGQRLNSLQKAEQCDWLIQPQELTGFSMVDQERSDEMFQIGYRRGKEVIEEIQKTIKK